MIRLMMTSSPQYYNIYIVYGHSTPFEPFLQWLIVYQFVGNVGKDSITVIIDVALMSSVIKYSAFYRFSFLGEYRALLQYKYSCIALVDKDISTLIQR